MNEIQISLSEVLTAAGEIRAVNEEIWNCLYRMRQTMNELEGSWISVASGEFRQRFSLFAARFETQKDVIESYAAFLERTVETYETLETTIQSNASQIQV